MLNKNSSKIDVSAVRSPISITMYRIAWRSLLTNATGHGQFIFPTREEIIEYVEELDRKHSGVITHWIESDKDPNH